MHLGIGIGLEWAALGVPWAEGKEEECRCLGQGRGEERGREGSWVRERWEENSFHSGRALRIPSGLVFTWGLAGEKGFTIKKVHGAGGMNRGLFVLTSSAHNEKARQVYASF